VGGAYVLTIQRISHVVAAPSAGIPADNVVTARIDQRAVDALQRPLLVNPVGSTVRRGEVVAASASALRRYIEKKILGPPYPTGAAQRTADIARIRAKLSRALAALSPSLRGVLQQLRALRVSEIDIFRGSHVIVGDAGLHYREWQRRGARQRSSSHYDKATGQQYELGFPGIGALLFGRDQRGNTWFQLEAHSKYGLAAVPHFCDFVKHKLFGNRQIGPAGASPYSEKNGRALWVPYLPVGAAPPAVATATKSA